MLQDLGFAERCALWVATADAMFLADRSNLTPALRIVDPRLAGYSLRAHVSLKGPDNVRRFYGMLVQSGAEFVLAFRGTRSSADYVANGLFDLVPFAAGSPLGRVHRGWRNLYRSARVTPAGPHSAGMPLVGGLHAAMAEARAASGDVREAAQLTVTAHSLGAAIATMFVLENSLLGNAVRPAVCTLASPMVGDAAFAARFAALKLDAWRVVVDRDTVPRLPGRRWGYRHVGTATVLAARTPGSPRRTHDIATYLSLLRER